MNILTLPRFHQICNNQSVYDSQQRFGSISCRTHRRNRRNGRSRNARRLLGPVGATTSRNASPKSSLGSSFGCLEVRRPSGTCQRHRCLHSRTSKLQSFELGIFRSHTQRLIDYDFSTRQQHRYELSEQSRRSCRSAQAVERTRHSFCLHSHRNHRNLYGHEAGRRHHHKLVSEVSQVLPGHAGNRPVGRKNVCELANQGTDSWFARCHNCGCLHCQRSNVGVQQSEAFPYAGTQTTCLACKVIARKSSALFFRSNFGSTALNSVRSSLPTTNDSPSYYSAKHNANPAPGEIGLQIPSHDIKHPGNREISHNVETRQAAPRANQESRIFHCSAAFTCLSHSCLNKTRSQRVGQSIGGIPQEVDRRDRRNCRSRQCPSIFGRIGGAPRQAPSTKESPSRSDRHLERRRSPRTCRRGVCLHSKAPQRHLEDRSNRGTSKQAVSAHSFRPAV